jgi:hypothetical protein
MFASGQRSKKHGLDSVQRSKKHGPGRIQRSKKYYLLPGSMSTKHGLGRVQRSKNDLRFSRSRRPHLSLFW